MTVTGLGWQRCFNVITAVTNIPKYAHEQLDAAREDQVVAGYPPAPTEHHHSRHFAGK